MFTLRHFLLSLCLLFFSGIQAYSQKLIGKELVKTDDLSSLVESGIGLLFGAKDIEGDINKVTVTDENFKGITIQIAYEGFTDNWLKGSVIGENKAAIQEIESEPVPFGSNNKVIEIHLELKGDVEKDAIESAFLKLIVCKNEDDVTGRVFVYQLPKQWKKSGLTSDEHYIQEDKEITLNPVPVGSASRLKDGGTVILPPPGKVARVKINKDIYQSKIERQPMKIPVQTLQNLQTADQKRIIFSPNIITDKQQYRQIEESPKDNTTRPLKIAKINLAPLQLSKEQIENGAEGPGNLAISLWDEINADINFDFGEDKISNISTDIFPDKNENSGYYYYYPTSYNLVWTPYESYNFKILYGSGSAGAGGRVIMFAKLSPSIGTREKQMVEELVKDYTTNNDLKFEKLLPIPLAEEPQIDLSGHLSNLYGIPSDSISINITNIFNPVDMAWPMDTKNADDLMVGLKEVDLNGNIKLVPQGEMPSLNIPVKISLDDKNILGRIELQNNLWRNRIWKNEMPFPVKLKYLHAFFINRDEKGETRPFIYSWNLGDEEVPVLSKVRFNASDIPKVVDNKAQKIWIEYSVPECMPCKDKIINELIGGTVSSREQKVEVVSLVLERLNAYVMEVTLRSKYADTKGESIVELPAIKVQEDMESYFSQPLFVPEGQNLEYEYKIKIITDDEILQSDWRYSDESSLYLNKSLVEQALGKFPGE